MKTDSIPKSKLEKAFNILIGMSWCVGISALLVGVENFSFYHYNDMGNLFMTVSLFAILTGLLVYLIKIALGSYLTRLGYKLNCKRGLHFGKSSKLESDRYGHAYGKCFYCKENLALKTYRIEINKSEYFIEASNMIDAIRKIQEQQNNTKSFGSIFTVTDLSRIGTHISTYIVKENGSLDIKK